MWVASILPVATPTIQTRECWQSVPCSNQYKGLCATVHAQNYHAVCLMMRHNWFLTPHVIWLLRFISASCTISHQIAPLIKRIKYVYSHDMKWCTFSPGKTAKLVLALNLTPGEVQHPRKCYRGTRVLINVQFVWQVETISNNRRRGSFQLGIMQYK